MDFFSSYIERKDHYSEKFLKGTFEDWLKISMRYEEFKKLKNDEEKDKRKRQKIIEVFCRETAYVLVGRILFTRIAEDKGILARNLSGKRLAEFLKFYEKRMENVYLRAFYDSREEINKYYSHLYVLGFFDWWRVSPEKKGLLTFNDKRIQERLENDLNFSVKKCLRRLNRFDFEQVNRDILGDVYQEYLPPRERKMLGEFYTPKQVVEYILDAVGYKPENELRGKNLLDPACGSGGFLVEAIKRLIARYRRVGFDLRNLDPDEAREIIEGCVNSIYGLDIHPFACFIAEMNLLFQLIDLHDIVRKKYPHYKLPRLNIFRTDSLIPPGESLIELSESVDNSRRKMLIQETRGADKIKSMKFCYVVGNPPYVRVDDIPQSYRTLYSKIYDDLLVGKWDIYIPFIHKAIEWLEESKRMGYIVKNKFFLLQHGLTLRKHILEYCIIELIIDLSGVKVFAESLPAPAIVIMQKRCVE